MKKHLCYLLALMMTFTASCSKEPESLDTNISESDKGKYTLKSFSAELDDEQTRTLLGTSNVVNWSAGDRIALYERGVAKSSSDLKYYIIGTGVNTAVGQFLPVNDDNILSYNNIENVVAVYPAIAAELDGTGELTFSINKEWPVDWVKKFNLTWTANSSRYTFTHNDIKVSYSATNKNFSGQNVMTNFKFRQLATRCTFAFDFTASEFAREELEAISIYADGTQISGTAKVDFSDAATPSLILTDTSEEATTITYEFNPVVLNSMRSYAFMLYPGESKKMIITATTNQKKFSFYATPDVDREPGTLLRFPINVNGNFTPGDETGEKTYAYTEIINIPDFYYYGNANCYLVMAENEPVDIDCTPYKSNLYYEKDKTNTPATSAPVPATAKVIWYENDPEVAQLSVSVDANVVKTDGKYSFNVTKTGGKGNALVGVYDADDNLLWSYHIWCPDIDPRDNLLTYGVTNTGAHKVMPMDLGATKIPTPSTDYELQPEGYGLYYQWGRKDPLGRVKGMVDASTHAITRHSVLINLNGTDKADWFNTQSANNLDGSILNLTQALTAAGYVDESDPDYVAGSLTNHTLIKMEGDQLGDYPEGAAIRADRWMIDQTLKQPAAFVGGCLKNGNWAAINNDNLWANPQGLKDPMIETLSESVFDPCPAGYRVAVADLWKNFGFADATQNGPSVKHQWNMPGGGVLASANSSRTRGYTFYYKGSVVHDENGEYQSDPADGATDFYPFTGRRNYKIGSLESIGTNSYVWMSASNGDNGQFVTFDANRVIEAGNARSYGIPVRCIKSIRN